MRTWPISTLLGKVSPQRAGYWRAVSQQPLDRGHLAVRNSDDLNYVVSAQYSPKRA